MQCQIRPWTNTWRRPLGWASEPSRGWRAQWRRLLVVSVSVDQPRRGGSAAGGGAAGGGGSLYSMMTCVGGTGGWAGSSATGGWPARWTVARWAAGRRMAARWRRDIPSRVRGSVASSGVDRSCRRWPGGDGFSLVDGQRWLNAVPRSTAEGGELEPQLHRLFLASHGVPHAAGQWLMMTHRCDHPEGSIASLEEGGPN